MNKLKIGDTVEAVNEFWLSYTGKVITGISSEGNFLRFDGKKFGVHKDFFKILERGE